MYIRYLQNMGGVHLKLDLQYATVATYIFKNSNTCMYTCMMYVNISINNVNVQYIISNTITAGM